MEYSNPRIPEGINVTPEHPLVGVVDAVHRDQLDVGNDVALSAKVEHLLGLADAADERAGDTAPLEDQLSDRG